MSENKLREALTAANTALRAARVGNCDYQWFCDAIKTAEDALSQLTPTLQPQPAPTCGQDCHCLVQCGDVYAHSGEAQPAPHTSPDPSQHDGTRGPFDGEQMSARKAAYFMRRFKQEEKLLGPNEQMAVDFVLAMLEQPAPQAGEVTDKEIERIVFEHTKVNPNQADDVMLMRGIRNAVRAILALRPAAQPMTPEQTPNPFAKRCYAMSEPHLSGYRLIVGFTSSDDAAAAHTFVANIGRHNGITAQGAEGGSK